MNSLRTKLLLLLLAIISVAWLTTAVFIYFDAHHEIDELFDAQLAQSAQVLLAQAGHDLKDAREDEDDDGIATEIAGAGHKYERKIAFQIRDEHGRLLLRSASVPVDPLAAQESGFADAVIEGKPWRVYTQHDDDGEIRVQVGERHAVRNELAASVAMRLLLPLGIALPVLALLIWFAVGKGLSPLRRIGSEVAQRDPANLAPLEERTAPVEITPLLHALNALLDRLETALESERRFTADAAHELRTPLAALKIQAQVASRAENAEQRRAALDNLILGVDRATRLIEQLLTLARLEPSGGSAELKPGCDLAAIARQVMADLAPAALEKEIELDLSSPDAAMINGNADMLAILLRNLVDNAIRYTPEHGRVNVSLQVELERVRLEVLDSGPGIPEQERQRVLDRFYRILGSDAAGSGLGLSIVKRVADFHAATLNLGAGESGAGLRVNVVFPLN
ncbi:MAG: sensor histidine kinase N-terminal domain-containing protein [Gallionella sp.]|nr:sensor histidine kinase N-terminal domain-containing protein [Gallionella sp.]MDP1704960.1 sensor histidine kinase N-terminal domain-containing protein [Sulfurimicrobium sp.]MDP2197500.1 sensor histidine kinase N-terminal domain-containing protein [Sulfurimicrobium sp.]MDP3686438.1 sensor histidine kinase N-terminal domain-containing protein [Sulfurimicrobium sp.]